MKQLEHITVKSRWEVAGYVAGLQENHAIISITSPGNSFVHLPGTPCCRGVLRLLFDDVFVDLEGCRPFTLEQAREVKVFLDRMQAHLLVCQCDYGISRSAGMAAAVAHVHGLDADRFFTRGRYDPNVLVLERILQVYQIGDLEQAMEHYRRLSAGGRVW